MTGVKTAATLMAFAALLAACTAPAVPPVDVGPVRTEEAACELAKARVSELRRYPVSNIRYCETIGEADSPEGLYLLALHARCREEICGSTNMDWFAIEKSTGHLFEWNMGEYRVGSPLDRRP